VAEAQKLPVLEAPRTLGQEPLYNLETTLRKQFKEVYLVDDKGTRIASIVSHDKKEQTKVGSGNIAYLCGLVVGAMGGRGDAPGGAALWAAREMPKMVHLDKYTLICIPVSRGGTLEAPVPVWKQAVAGRAQLIEMSLKKHPVPKRTRDAKAGSEDEVPDVWL
jgi:hypothetical protein